MINRLLIVSSDLTGHGHKSITESLIESMAKKYPDVKIKVIDGFTISGPVTRSLGDLYSKVTRVSKETWKFLWDATNISPDIMTEMIYINNRNEFLAIVKEFNPDLILSVHPFFNASITKILHRSRVNIPFVVLIADLVSISALWANNKADYTLCPTEESKERCISYGMDPDRLIVTGFPVRSKFFSYIGSEQDNQYYTGGRPLRCLIMGGGEGVGNMRRIAKVLLDNFDVRVEIVTGRNEALKKKLESTLGACYGEKVVIHGFLTNLHELMSKCDIAFLRGSPNVNMEAVSCALPMVITSALPGQEEENPDYFEKYGLAVVCKSPIKLKKVISDLLANNGAKLRKIKETQKRFRKPQTADTIVDFLMTVKKKKPSEFSTMQRNRRRLRFLRIKALNRFK